MLYYPVYHYHSEMVFTPREQYIAIFSPMIFESLQGDKLPESLQKRIDEFKAEEPALFAEIEEAIKGFPPEDFLELKVTVPEIVKHGGIIDGLKKLATKLESKESSNEEPQGN